MTMRLLMCAMAACVSFGASAQMTPVGLWKTIDDNTGKARSHVRVVETGGVVSGRIDRLVDSPDAATRVCEKCPDDLKGKPIVGLPILKDLKKTDDEEPLWSGGTILDPENGKSYRVRLTPLDGGKRLRVRGYVGAPMFGRTQVWVRVE